MVREFVGATLPKFRNLGLLGDRLPFDEMPGHYHPDRVEHYRERVAMALSGIINHENAVSAHLRHRDKAYGTFKADSFPKVLGRVLEHELGTRTIGLSSFGAVNQKISALEAVAQLYLLVKDLAGSLVGLSDGEISADFSRQLDDCIVKSATIPELCECVRKNAPALAAMVSNDDIEHTVWNQNCYERAFRAAYRELLIWAKKSKYRILLTTGGGPGFAMEQTCRLFQQEREKLGFDTNTGVILQGLGYIPREQPNGLHDKGMLIRPMSDFGDRWFSLSCLASGVTKSRGGIGTDQEVCSSQLETQMFRIEGFYVLGATVIYVMDCLLTEWQCEALRAQGLQAEYGKARMYDTDAEAIGRKVVTGAAKAQDFQLMLRLKLDEGPEEMGKRLASEHIRWHQMRQKAGVCEVEYDALSNALKKLPKPDSAATLACVVGA